MVVIFPKFEFLVAFYTVEELVVHLSCFIIWYVWRLILVVNLTHWERKKLNWRIISIILHCMYICAAFSWCLFIQEDPAHYGQYLLRKKGLNCIAEYELDRKSGSSFHQSFFNVLLLEFLFWLPLSIECTLSY